jgi:hypothetical protein
LNNANDKEGNLPLSKGVTIDNYNWLIEIKWMENKDNIAQIITGWRKRKVSRKMVFLYVPI